MEFLIKQFSFEFIYVVQPLWGDNIYLCMKSPVIMEPGELSLTTENSNSKEQSSS
jgi:hypothetical protein